MNNILTRSAFLLATFTSFCFGALTITSDDIAWEYHDGVIDVVLHPERWPKDCFGVNLMLRDINGRAVSVNQEPLIFRALKVRDYSKLVSGSPELLKRAEEASAAWFKTKEEYREPPSKIIKIRLKYKYIYLLAENPDLLYVHGVRTSLAVGEGIYTLVVNELNEAGNILRSFEMPMDTSKSPDISEPKFLQMEYAHGGIGSSWEFAAEEFSSTVHRMEFGYFDSKADFHLAGTGTQAFKMPATTNFVYTADLKDVGKYELALRVSDFFGGRKIFRSIKKKKTSSIRPELKINKLRTGTNGIVIVNWKLMSDEPIDHYRVSLICEEGHSIENPGPTVERIVGEQFADNLSFQDRFPHSGPTSVVYRVVVRDGLDTVGHASVTYRHPGCFRPPLTSVASIETNRVNNKPVIMVVPANLDMEGTRLAHSILIHVPSDNLPWLAVSHSTNAVIQLPSVYNHKSFGLSIRAETIPPNNAENPQAYLAGEWSKELRVEALKE